MVVGLYQWSDGTEADVSAIVMLEDGTLVEANVKEVKIDEAAVQSIRKSLL